MLIQCDCDSRAFALNGVTTILVMAPSREILPEFLVMWHHCQHVQFCSFVPSMLTAWFCWHPLLLLWLSWTKDKSLKGDGCEADLKEKLCWFYRCQFPRLMETQPFIKGPQREATSREQPSSDVKRSIMQYVFLADSVSRELADKIGSRDKLCGRIIHVHGWWIPCGWWDASNSHSLLTSSHFHYESRCALMMCACSSILVLLLLIHNVTVEEYKMCCSCSVWLRLLGKIWGCGTSALVPRLHS